MDKIKQLIAGLKESLKGNLNANSTPDDIKKVDGLCANLDEIEQESLKVDNARKEVTDMYIKAVKNQGSTEKPKDEESKEDTSLESIGQKILDEEKTNK